MSPDTRTDDELPQQYAHDTALAALQAWMTSGRAAAATAPLDFDPNGAAAQDGASGGIATDAYGNGLGGLRLPQIQVPVAQYQGTCPEEGQMLIGTTRPFSDTLLHQLYPTFAAYRTKMCQASLADIRQGVLLPFDAQDIDRRVQLGRGRWPAGAQGNGSSVRACAAIYGSSQRTSHPARPHRRHRRRALRHRRRAHRHHARRRASFTG